MLLTALIFLPLVVLLVLQLSPRKVRDQQLGQWLNLAVLGAQAVVFVGGILPNYLANYKAARGGLVLQERFSWLRISLGDSGILQADYFLGVDGFNLWMLLLTLIVLAVAVLASGGIRERRGSYFSLLLLLNAALMGCFLAMDFLLFYICYEFMLLPLFFLIAIWGGDRSRFAAFKFFLYTLFGSMAMLLVMIGSALSHIDPVATAENLRMVSDGQIAPGVIANLQELLAQGNVLEKVQVHSFNILSLSNPANRVPGAIMGEAGIRMWAFWGMFIAFAVKLPAVPIHSWLPDAHVRSATPVSIILAGILLKVGGYGLIRFTYSFFPEQAIAFAPWVAALGVVAILYAGLIALAQPDLKALVAFSSISHMGFVLLGLGALQAEAINGAILQLFNHGVISALLFFLVGVLYSRVGSRHIDHFNGLWHKMPRYTTFIIIAFFAGLGLPGFSLFVGELLVLSGSFKAAALGAFSLWWVGLAVLGIIIAAGYFMRPLRTMFFGDYRVNGGDDWTAKLTDLSAREMGIGLLLVFWIILLGVWPQPFIELMEDSVFSWLKLF